MVPTTAPCARRHPRLVPVAVALAAAAVLSVAVGPGSGAGAGSPSAREQRAQVRAEQAQVAARVDALRGDEQQVQAALVALEENVRGQQAALDDARRQIEESTAQVAEAEAAIADTGGQIDELRAALVAQAVEAYIDPPDDDFFRRLRAVDAQEDAARRALLDMRAGEQIDVVDELRAAQQRLDDERRRAEDARRRAEQASADAEQALAGLEAARAEQAAFAEQVRGRLEASLAESAHLAQLDADLSRQVAAEQAALAAMVRPAAKAPASTPSAASATGSRVSVRRPALATVGTITVAASVADQLRALLAAASSDGIFLGGYGYRDVNIQIALRAQNCGGWSDRAIYEVPAEQCSPPTARPGSSLHEQGLAVDFSVNGRFIESRSSEEFRWLAANAGRFGFHNLPSEPWHWSTTGG